MFFDVSLSTKLEECGFCGAPSRSGDELDLTFRSSSISVKKYDETLKEKEMGESRGICSVCHGYWNRLDAKLNREASLDEFAVWVLTQIGKKTVAGNHFTNGGKSEAQVDMYGSIFGDFAKLLMEEAGVLCRITCPSCGDVANLENVHGIQEKATNGSLGR